MYSAYKLNKQDDHIQPWCTPFPIWNQSVVPCLVLTVSSWTACRFLRRQVMWSGIPMSWRIFQFVVIHTVKGFAIVNKTEVDVFLEFSCFFYDPVDAGNLISGSFVFLNQPKHLEVLGSHSVEAWLGEFWTLLCWHVRWGQLCNSLRILWHSLSLGLECKEIFSSPWLGMPDLLAYWVQHFHSIISEDLK